MSIVTKMHAARTIRTAIEGLESRRLFAAAVLPAVDPVVNPLPATATVSGNVFNDLNRDGVRQSGEAGVAGIIIKLTPLPTSAGGTPTTLMTDANGHYVFEHVAAGRYGITETVPAGQTQTKPATGYEITVTDGQKVVDENFGLHQNEAPVETAKINGRVFNDLNNNGVRDAGEPGLAGVTVTLSHNGAVKAFVTGTSGEYGFAGLTAGAYSVTETVLSGYVVTVPIGNKYDITLTPGQVASDKFFGQHKKEAVAKFQIRGKVWNDVDNDGIFDTNEIVSGVTTVYIDANGNGNFDAGERSTQSNANGEYVLDGLPNGTYQVSRVVPNGYHLSNGTGGGKSVTVSVSGATVTGVNLGIGKNPVTSATATISGLLFFDADKDGILDHGETAGGARTVFIDTNGNGKLDDGEKSTQSNNEGRYYFTGLAAGTYHISRVFPAGYHLSNNHDGFVTVTVTAGQVKTDVNLGSALND